MYKWRPRIAVSNRPIAATMRAAQVSVRFQLFDTFPPLASNRLLTKGWSNPRLEGARARVGKSSPNRERFVRFE
jgi:hypothetical protein